MVNMYLTPADDWGCCLCSGSPPPAGSEVEMPSSSGAVRASVAQTEPPPSWQKMSPCSSREGRQTVGGQSLRHLKASSEEWL